MTGKRRRFLCWRMSLSANRIHFAGTCARATTRPGGARSERSLSKSSEWQNMTAQPDDQLGFAPDDDTPIPYMARTRQYYQAIGYTTPYRWAHYVDAPFQPLRKPLAQSRVTIVTTAAPYDPAKGDQGPGAAYNGG